MAVAHSPGGIGAVALGSAVHTGHRLDPAEEPVVVDDLVRRLDARGYRLFGGKIDRHTLKFPERAVVTALRVPAADNRDRPSIRAWGREIGTSLARAERTVS